MSATTEQDLRMLHDFRAATPDIEAAAVVSPDGFIIASLLPADVEEERMAAISAAMLAMGVKTSADLRKGTLHQVFIRGEDGCIALMNAGGGGAECHVQKESTTRASVYGDETHCCTDWQPSLSTPGAELLGEHRDARRVPRIAMELR